jgi:flagellar biosynthesis chaperone FliJ
MLTRDPVDGSAPTGTTSDALTVQLSAHTARLRSRQLRAEMRARLDELAQLQRRRPGGSAGRPSRTEELLQQMNERLTAAQGQISHLETALQSNRRIGMAIGIVMTRFGLTEQQAFERLSRHSQQTNTKLRELAEQVVYTGTL